MKTKEKRAESVSGPALWRGQYAKAREKASVLGHLIESFVQRCLRLRLAAMNSTSPFIASLYVALGGAGGAVARYQTGRAMTRWMGSEAMMVFPWATLAVNTIGSLAMGLLAGFLMRMGGETDGWRLLIGVGLLGGFTTFSAFSLEMAMLIQRGQIGLATLYALLSLALGVTGLFFGLTIARLGA